MSEKDKTDGLSVNEAKDILGVSAEAVRRYIRDGKLPAKKKRVLGLKTEWVITREALRAFQESP